MKDWVMTYFKFQNQVTEDIFEEFKNLNMKND